MSCYRPLLGVQDGVNPSGKPHISVKPHGTDPAPFEQSGFETMPIRCGQCIGCRIDYSREWANRLILELQDHDQYLCHFVTLTYDDSSLNDRCFVIGEDDQPHYSLNKRDLQLFMKRLRNRVGSGVRFYAVGEYGDQSQRPHYHLILFNCPLSDYDSKLIGKSKLGFEYRSSSLLERVWPYGYNIIAPVTWESCAYTARYMMKKLKGDSRHVYDYFGVEKPFSVASRKPGLGKAYYENHSDLSEVAYWSIAAGDSSKHVPPPAYFKRLFEKDQPEAAENRKELIKAIASERRRLQLAGTDLDELTYLANEEKQLERKLSVLKNYRTL